MALRGTGVIVVDCDDYLLIPIDRDITPTLS